ncbi:MAG: Sua5/YciO/YrdC/YwlC family protein, partial [Candidatus Korarchaeota archaeon]|nr:Sua5/YciO/YrdC/YwlC family protein [Candidatus Korarchaeota archaeon]
MPYTALHYLLLQHSRDKFLIMTSGNRKGRPMCIDEECARRELAGIADYFLLHDRAIVNRVDDSVVRLSGGEPVFLRRSRGYAPRWVRLPYRLPEALALGADLQTAGAVAFEDKVVLTQYIGDVDEPAVLMDYNRDRAFFTRAYSVKPRLVAVDKHPGYRSRRLGLLLAEKHGARIVEVQHHHAHALQAMAELGMGLDEHITAITIDGTGYGDDGTIWGGEVLYAGARSYERLGHIEAFPLPGGDRAAYYPVRSLIGLLSTFMGEEEVLGLLEERRLLGALPRGRQEAWIALRQSLLGKAPLTSSLGRLVDAVAALLKVCLERTYEGEPAIRLEDAARRGRRSD